MNPIFAREIRARWRDRRSFWLLFLLTVALCLGATWIYSEQIEPRAARVYATSGVTTIPIGQGPETQEARVNRTGRELFRALAMGNALAWLLIAPVLTATGIARERERGLLESLQLSGMSVRSQIAARYGAALAFLLLLQTATLPIYGTTLLLGGVSPGEVGFSALIVAMGAALGAALGLFFSARAARPTGALFGALAAIAAWSALSFYFLNANWGTLPQGPIEHFITFSHPLLLLDFLSQRGQYQGPRGALFDFNLTFFCVALLQLGTIFLLLKQAGRDCARQLPPPSWQGRNPWVEGWKRERTARLAAARLVVAENARESRNQKIEGALLADLPLDRFVRFRDPILAREVKSRFRLRRASLPVTLARLALLGGGICVWLWSLFSIFDPEFRPNAAFNVLGWLAVPGVLVVGVLAAQSFVRERESGTWESLRLSLLGAAPLVRAKWLSPLVSLVYYSAPLWVLLPFTVGFTKTAPPIFSVLLLLALALSALALASALGLWISWRSKNAATATCWTLGLILGFWFGVPFVGKNFGLKDQVISRFVGFTLAEYEQSMYGSSSKLRQLFRIETGLDSTTQDGWKRFQQWQNRKLLQHELLSRWTNVLSPWEVATLLDEVIHYRRFGQDPLDYSRLYIIRPDISELMHDWKMPLTIAGTHLVLSALLTLVLLLDLRRRVEKSRGESAP